MAFVDGGKAQIPQLVEAVGGADPDIALAVFEQRHHPIAVQAVTAIKLFQSARTVAPQALIGGADQQPAIVVVQQYLG